MHYYRQRRHGNPLIIKLRGPKKFNTGKCIVKNCHNAQRTRNMCNKHYQRWRTYGNPLIVKPHGFQKGSKNINWRGGVAEYKNHSLMKKLRLKKLELINFKCEECGAKATHIYHKNKNKQDQRIANYIALCIKCFYKRLRIPKGTSKYLRLYGMRLKDMAQKLNISHPILLNYLKKDPNLVHFEISKRG